MYSSSISGDESILAAYFTQAIVRLRHEMKRNMFLRKFYPTFTPEGGRELHIDYSYESVTLFTDEQHQVKLPKETDYYLLWVVANNSHTSFRDKYKYGYWSSPGQLIAHYISNPAYLLPGPYSITRPIDNVLDEISKRVYHRALVEGGEITFDEAYGAVGVVCDDLGINFPGARMYYDCYDSVKASPRRISSYQKKVKKNKI